ncbi:helix-turn-helix domain-containing protein [Ruegeria conchae]|uniref:helix-turn-helix domain-containing protein n=1 Tax=Ruegeria conchae TaxID=981384 RepID=UPI000EB2FC6C|nr:LysR family transcriptional regulator [Ruegeria conchae]UWR05714.1 LysR family transcriptional regulator [Ruegeria conchae]
MKNGFRNWSDIRVFLSVFREGSTLAASRKLQVSQPTVARRIAIPALSPFDCTHDGR